MQESQQLFFGLRLVSRIFEEFQHPPIQTQIVLNFGGFFHPIKVCQPIGRKDSTQAFLYLVAQNCELFSKIKLKLKKSKTLSADIIWPDGTLKTY
jgi:hypothetical protein